MNILVRNLSPKVVKTLDELAKKNGYKSREEFLRNHFETITALSEIKEFERKYDKLLNTTLSIIEKNTEVMSKFIEESLIEI